MCGRLLMVPLLMTLNDLPPVFQLKKRIKKLRLWKRIAGCSDTTFVVLRRPVVPCYVIRSETVTEMVFGIVYNRFHLLRFTLRFTLHVGNRVSIVSNVLCACADVLWNVVWRTMRLASRRKPSPASTLDLCPSRGSSQRPSSYKVRYQALRW